RGQIAAERPRSTIDRASIAPPLGNPHHHAPHEDARAPPGGSCDGDTRARLGRDSRSRDAETRRQNRYWQMISPQARIEVPCWTETNAAPRPGETCGGATTLKTALPAPLAVNVMSTTLLPEPHDVPPVKTSEVYWTPGERPLIASWTLTSPEFSTLSWAVPLMPEAPNCVMSAVPVVGFAANATEAARSAARAT